MVHHCESSIIQCRVIYWGFTWIRFKWFRAMMLRLGEVRQVKPCFIACPADESAAAFIHWNLIFRQQALGNSNKVHFDQMTRLKLSLRATPRVSGEWWKPNWTAETSWWTRTLILHPGGKQKPGNWLPFSVHLRASKNTFKKYIFLKERPRFFDVWIKECSLMQVSLQTTGKTVQNERNLKMNERRSLY